MAKKSSPNPADYIAPLNMNGLQGRMLRMPAPKRKNREILLIYGHHALLERWWSLAQNLNAYGKVTMPDLPGFGGMDSFYKIGKRPSVDNYADYLASFVKLRFKQRHITIVGISFGFVIATRMLQRYPELAKKVDLIVSLVGFTHKDDLVFRPITRLGIIVGGKLFSTRPMAFIIRYGCLNDFVIRNLYKNLSRPKIRFAEASPAEFTEVIDFDVYLWQNNDVRTHWCTTAAFMTLNNCQSKVNVPVWHVCAKDDYYFNFNNVEQHMRIVFEDYNKSTISIKAHTPSILASKKEMSVFLPMKLRRVLSKN
jgi:pimeloyl-ACP methyl ester carboxylesterase